MNTRHVALFLKLQNKTIMFWKVLGLFLDSWGQVISFFQTVQSEQLLNLVAILTGQEMLQVKRTAALAVQDNT